MFSFGGGFVGDSGLPPSSVTDLFNGFNRVAGDSYTGGPTVVLDNTGALITPPVNRMGIEGGRLSYNLAEGATLGPELVTNGDFSGGSTGWTLGTGWAIVANGDGGYVARATAATTTLRNNNAAVAVNKYFRVEYAVANYVSGEAVAMPGGYTGVGNRQHGDNGTFVEQIKTTHASTVAATFIQGASVAPFSGDVVRVSCKEVLPVWLPYSNSGNALALWGDSMTIAVGLGYGFQMVDQFPLSTVTNGGVGGETSTQIKTRMVAATSRHGDVTVIWAGRNNYTSPATVKADIAAMVAALSTQRFAVVSVFNGSTATEYKDGANYDIITQLNADLKALYPDNFIDLRLYVVSQYNPSMPQDVADFANDVPPTSLRKDWLHLNYAGNNLAGAYVADWIRGKGWMDVTGSPLWSSQSVKTRKGVVQKYASTFRGFLNEPARTNLFLNSAAPVTQNITTTAQQYTVSVRGTGSITLSGTATGVATEASPLTVTATAGTLTCTVAGSLQHAQVEAGAFKTSPITTAGATVTRAATVYIRPNDGRLRANTQGIAVRVFPSAAGQTGVLWSTRVDANNYSQISATPTTLVFSKTIAGVTTSATVNYTHAANTPFIAMAHQDPAGGMKVRAKQDGGAWTAYGTNASISDMPIGTTYQTGVLNGASHFAGNYPYVELVQSGLTAFEAAIQ